MALQPACNKTSGGGSQLDGGVEPADDANHPASDALPDLFPWDLRVSPVDGSLPDGSEPVEDARTAYDQAIVIEDVAVSPDVTATTDAGPVRIDGPSRGDALGDRPADGTSALVVRFFNCSPSVIRPGNPSLLRWDVQGSDSVSIDNDIGIVSPLSSLAIGPAETTTYTLTAVSSSGETVSVSTTVTVVPPAAIISFTADETVVSSGQATILRGEFTGGTGRTEQGTVTSPFEQSTGPLTSSHTFTLYVTDAMSTIISARVTITVVPAPSITQFFAATTTIRTGTVPVLAAIFENGAGEIDQGIGPVSSGVAVTGPVQTEARTYTLTVTSPAGVTVTAQLTVGVADTGFEPTGSMADRRLHHTATLLGNGKVLIAGSYHNLSGYLSNATLYDPATGTFSSTGGMSAARGYHTATLLPDGRVLVTGGHDYYTTHASADVYDPETGRFTATGSMTRPRRYHCAAALADGRVLIVGGNDDSSTQETAEIYDPATGRFTSTGSMAEQRQSFNVVTLANGKVLVVSGNRRLGLGSFTASTTAELYDPVTGTFSLAGTLSMARDYATVTLLADGKVLIAGGYNDPASISAEIYDPDLGTFTPTGGLTAARAAGHTATLLDSGKVLLVGGCSKSWVFPLSAEVYDPATGLFTATGPLSVPREHHTATLLPDGSVLVAGGEFINPNEIVTITYASAEIYR